MTYTYLTQNERYQISILDKAGHEQDPQGLPWGFSHIDFGH